ncbi:urate hydroxylase PuuD [Microvirga lotononidis]|uniref:Putative membrane protein n=1 Tax=Microvirga lotononidis TaxID=864069 RepID=I4YW55_9HYPH|nr:urate hydroxylase PuuD [Microvirga lotononidis]EIM28197.1 putative membrane protein [Microvirga lotononidis]WQO27704.1 urate hydroxylase PuuD [Microvirga lotononidis]
MIDPQISEWISQIIRWTHVITAIAWIGSSFYFIHLDLSLKKREGLPEGVGGEAWQVHGGGFYNMRKYLVAPPEMPKELTWFKWESYSTWISGFFLIVWVYYLHADLYTIDPSVRALAPWQAPAIGIGGLVVSWFVYEGLCRSPLGKNGIVLGVALFVYILLAAFGFTQVFNGRAAFLHTGAMIATWMSASVFFIIIPNQKKVVDTLLAGGSPDPKLGKEAKLRSTHNNYLTLPVIFLMLSNHYPLAWSSRYSVAIIGMIVIAGAAIRHFFNSQHAGKGSPWWTWALAALCIWAAIWLSILGKPGNANLAASTNATPAAVTASFDEAVLTIQSRCSMCHAAEPAWDGITTAPKGVRLDTPEEIARHAEMIRVQSVLTHAMPPNNITEMTLDERRAVATWLAAKDTATR